MSKILSIAFLVTTIYAEQASVVSTQCEAYSNILWPSYENHKNFYICTSDLKAAAMACELPLKFDFFEQKCVFASEWRAPPDPLNILPITRLRATNADINCDEIARWPVTKHRSHFFQCITRDYVIERQCAPAEVFDFEQQACAPFSPACHAHEINLLWADPSSLEHFFRCTAVGESVREQCSEGLHFVFQIQMCTQIAQTTPVVQRAPNCTYEQLHLRWPDPAHDRNYFTCTGIGEYELNSCLNGYIFEFMVQMCIVDHQATMTPVMTPETTTQWGQEVTQPTTRNPFDPLECRDEDLHLLWPVVGYIYDFYICMGPGHSERRNCPQGMIFVFEIQMCTNDPRVPTTTTSTTTTLNRLEKQINS